MADPEDPRASCAAFVTLGQHKGRVEFRGMSAVAQVLGYKGQRLGFLGSDEFVTVQGTGLLVTNVDQAVPTNMIWRSESGVNCFAWHGATSRLAIAPAFGNTVVEVVEYELKSPGGAGSSATLAVPGKARIIDMAFSRNGERLFALSDASESMVLCWDVATGALLFSSPLNGVVYSKVAINPGNDTMLCIFGDHGIQVGIISDVLGVFSVRFQPLYIEPEFRFEESEVSAEVRSAAVVMANAVTCAIWVPFDYLLVTNLQGNILEVPVAIGSGGEALVHVTTKSSLKKMATFGDSSASVMHATNIAMGNATLIVCTSVGTMFWFPTHSFTQVPDAAIVDCTTPLQIASADGYISALAIDPTFQRLVVGTFSGQILRLPVDVQERPVDENAPEDDVDGGFQTDSQIKVDETPLVVTGAVVGSHQSGAVVCSASMAIPNSINKKHLPLLVLGSQDGILSFWLHPPPTADSSSATGIPGAPSLLTSINLGTLGDADSTAIVSSMTALPFRRKGNGQLLCVGLDSGLLQIWEVTSEFFPGDNVDEPGHRLSTKRLASRRFYTCPLTTITASTLSTPSSSTLRYCLAVASSSENCVHVVQLFNTVDAYTFDVQCVLKLEDTLLPTALVWNGPSLCICASNGSVCKFDIGAMHASEVSADLIYPTPQMSCTPLGPQQHLALTQSYLLNPDTLVGVAAGSSTLLSVSLKQGGQAVVVPCGSHSDALICCAKCPTNKFLATGCADGSVHVWRIDNEASFSLVNRMDLHAGPVINLAFSSDTSLLFSAAADGSYFLSAVEKSTMVEPIIMKLNEMGTVDAEFTASRADAGKTWMEQKKECLDQELKEKNSSKSSSVDAAVSDLTSRLHSLLEENADRSELEKMDRSEFVVDLTGQESINADNERRVALVRNSYFKLNAWNELVAARVRQTCWDLMAAQSRCLLPLLDDVQNENLTVSSMPVRKCSEEEILSLERVKRLRAIEVRSQQKDSEGSVTKLPSGKSRCTWSKSIQGCPEVVSWISFDGARWPCSDVVEMIAEREKEDAAKTGKAETPEEEAEVSLVEDDEGSQTADAAREVDDNDVINLLYPPQCVKTQTQKRVQIILLKEVGRLIRAKFNVHFDRLVRDKEDTLSSVESRNLRIRAILEELKQEDEFMDPKWKETEVAGSAITVTDDEVVSRPYESEVQRAARVREEEERRRREAEKDKEDVKGRALDEMMHGTLEVKRDVFAEASSLQRPAWMDEVAQSDMTEAQLKEMDAFEVRFKMLQEEQAKYRKTLEVELKKLKTEAIEVCKAFDEKLVGMVKLKVHVQREILSQELYISRISQSMVQRDQLWQLLKKNEIVIKSTRVQRNELRSKIDTFNVEVEGVRTRLALAQEEERTMEKGFKRDIQNLCNVSFDQDQLKVFNQLYHIRVYPTVEENDDEAEESEILKSDPKAGGGAGVKGRSPGKDKPKDASSLEAKGTQGDSQEFAAESVRDPFFYALLQQQRKKKSAEAEIPLMSPLDMATECPEAFEVDQFVWSKLQELRNARIEKEIECTLLSREYGELKRKLDQLCSEEAVVLTCLKDLVAIKEEMSSKLGSLENNLIVLVSVKQGQDEVDREAIVTDYSSAALVPVDVIRKFNGRIKEHGKEKIGVLNRIKQFRRKINILDWEAKHLSLESHHFEEYYTDLQLLRVTRELQHVIRDGSNAEQAKARIDRVGARKDFLQKDAEERIRKLKQSNETLRRLVKGRTEESNSLHDKIQKLAGEVDARQSVLQSRDDARGTTGNPSATAQMKMKKVMARRHLADTARAQAEEIDFLRQELDRMRQRTFPSFSRTIKSRTNGV